MHLWGVCETSLCRPTSPTVGPLLLRNVGHMLASHGGAVWTGQIHSYFMQASQQFFFIWIPTRVFWVQAHLLEAQMGKKEFAPNHISPEFTQSCPMCTSIGMFGGFLSHCLWPTVVSLVQTANNSRWFTTQLCTRESKVTFEPHLTVLWILVSSWHQEEKKYCLYSEINS